MKTIFEWSFFFTFYSISFLCTLHIYLYSPFFENVIFIHSSFFSMLVNYHSLWKCFEISIWNCFGVFPMELLFLFKIVLKSFPWNGLVCSFRNFVGTFSLELFWNFLSRTILKFFIKNCFKIVHLKLFWNLPGIVLELPNCFGMFSLESFWNSPCEIVGEFSF